MKKLMSAFLFLSALLCSYSHYYYVPSTQNVPLFREKNEIRISGTLAEGEEIAFSKSYMKDGYKK